MCLHLLHLLQDCVGILFEEQYLVVENVLNFIEVVASVNLKHRHLRDHPGRLASQILRSESCMVNEYSMACRQENLSMRMAS